MTGIGVFFYSSIKFNGNTTNPPPTKIVKNIHPTNDKIPVTYIGTPTGIFILISLVLFDKFFNTNIIF